jgi:hypothetical protein
VLAPPLTLTLVLALGEAHSGGRLPLQAAPQQAGSCLARLPLLLPSGRSGTGRSLPTLSPRPPQLPVPALQPAATLVKRLR